MLKNTIFTFSKEEQRRRHDTDTATCHMKINFVFSVCFLTKLKWSAYGSAVLVYSNYNQIVA